jgi:predicted DNA-binding protein with PD1-like motif
LLHYVQEVVRIQSPERGEMRSKLIADDPKTFALILETGDEVLSSLKAFAHGEHLSSSSFKAIGALLRKPFKFSGRRRH